MVAPKSFGFKNSIKLFMLLILLASYFFISIDVFSTKSFSERKIIQKLSKNKFGNFIVKFLGYIVYLSIVSLLIYFLYNMHINILIFAVYFKSMDSLLRFLRKKPDAKDLNLFSKIRVIISAILK